MTSRHPAKKPSGGRPNVRKLLSKDSLSSLASFIKPDSSSSDGQSSAPASTSSRKATQASAATSLGVISEKGSSPWLGSGFVSSPKLEGSDVPAYISDKGREGRQGSSADFVRTSGTSSPLSTIGLDDAESPASREERGSFESGGLQPPPSPASTVRWQSLRHHILPEVQLSSSPAPTFTSFSQLPASTPTGQAQHLPVPKPSRLATRFGFRQVVTETRLAADETTRRFADEILKTCWETRIADSRLAKPEREASQPSTFGSTLHLPFMSSTSLPLTNASMPNLSAPSTFKSALRGAPSTVNLNISVENRLHALTNLQGIIMRYAAIQDSVVSKCLPHEQDVLSVLLVPFLRVSTDPIVEDERRLSFQLFEFVIGTWRPTSDTNIQRCTWCCKAAATPPSPLRARILYILKGILSSEETPLNSVNALITIFAQLIVLAEYLEGRSSPMISSSSYNQGELSIVFDMIDSIMSGKIGSINMEDFERRHNAIALDADDIEGLRKGTCVEAILNCSEYGPMDQRATILRYAEKYWSSLDLTAAITPLWSKVHLDKISAFLRSALSISQDSLGTSHVLSVRDTQRILALLSKRVFPELSYLKSGTENALRSSCIRILFLILTFDAVHEPEDDTDDTFAEMGHSQARDVLLDCIADKSWSAIVDAEVKNIPSTFEWSMSPTIAYNLLFSLPEDARRRVAGLLAPQVQEKLGREAPFQPSEPLARLLTLLATLCPQVFYRPLFVCAASSKEEVVTKQMSLLIALGRFMRNFWTSDAEMLSVALMSDPGSSSSGKGKMKEDERPPWGKPRLGQTMILLEVIANIQAARKEHEAVHSETTSSSIAFAKVLKFVTSLETRLAVLLNAKEEASLVPVSHRILFAVLFREIRLLTGTLKSATWLPRLINWTIQHAGSDATFQESIPEGQRENLWSTSLQIYTSREKDFKPSHQRKGTANVLSPQRHTFFEAMVELQEETRKARVTLLESLSSDPLASLLSALVTMYGSLKHEDYVRLSPVLWERCLLLAEKQSVLNASFLCMQCAEKAHDKFVNLVMAHLQSPKPSTRRESVHRLGVLSNWRFQLLSLNFITDRNSRRPFKLARSPLSFVATDIGDSKYVPLNDVEDAITGKKHALPLDIRRRLLEIGWADEEQPIDEVLEWRRTPMSLLGTTQIDQIAGQDSTLDDASGSDHGHSPSPGNSPSKSPPSKDGMTRQNSTYGKHPGKRRPVFVEPLVSVFIPLAKLAMERDQSVASAARDLILDYMRDDPAVLCRCALTILSDKRETIDKAVTAFRHLMSLQDVLPPRFTHHAFNHLAGFLKFLAKNIESQSQNALYEFAYVLPLLAKLAPQLSDISIRGIRRAKIEVFMFPSGTLYFSDPAPLGPMFPRGPGNIDPFADCPTDLLHVVMIRMAQNMFALDMLRRNSQDAHIVRKSWSPLVLPDILFYTDDESTLPRRFTYRAILDQSKPTFRLSLSFSRTHLLLVSQLFRCLTRHLNDRNELVTFLEGVNLILLRHRDDIGIVSHAVIAYLIASTRFRRLMSSGTGFTIFLPTLLKVYCEAEGDASVREVIEYAFHRFFAVHEESFVYQALQVVSNVVIHPDVDGHWVASTTYYLLSTLKSNPSSFDASGVRDATKAQEEETALAITADERPQVFLASLREKGRTNAEKLQNSFSLDIFDNKRFQPDNVVRMVLTVIAHDPTIRRAQYFLRLFRFLVPHLYSASSSARVVLRDGVDALANIVSSRLAKAKEGPGGKAKANEVVDGAAHEKKTQEKIILNASSPCDVQMMRCDYLMLFASYVKEGGAHRATSLQKSLELVKVLLRDAAPTGEATNAVRIFMDQLGETFIIRQDVKYTVSLLKDLAPIIKMYGSIIDLTGLFKSLARLSTSPAFANDNKFTDAVVSQICPATLEVVELAAQENILASLEYIPSLVTLLVESVCLLGSDVVGEIEKRDANPGFLSGLVLPFIFQLRTTKDLALNTQWTDSTRQDAHARAWVQLLSYSVSAFSSPFRQERTGLKTRDGITRSPSFTSPDLPSDEDQEVRHSSSIRRPKRKTSGQSNVVASVRLSIALITIKAVIARGGDDISKSFPGAWVHLGGVIRTLLQEGNISFVFRPEVLSVPASPIPSPLSTKSFAELMEKPFEHSLPNSSSQTLLPDSNSNATFSQSRPSSPIHQQHRKNSGPNFPSPRFVDYMLWSLLEFLCLKSTPLSLQLRTLMHEKAYNVNELLRDRHASSTGPFRPRAARPGTIYSKPRMKPPSPSSTPGASPRLGPSEAPFATSGTFSSISSLSPNKNLDVDPFNPTRSPINRPQPLLRTNEPVSQAYLSPAFIPASVSTSSVQSRYHAESSNFSSDMAIDSRQVLCVTMLRSPLLIRHTYERIRVVQRYLGYKTLLPLPQDAIDSARNSLDAHERHPSQTQLGLLFTTQHDKDAEPRAWSKAQTAEILLSEARDIINAWLVESAIKPSPVDLNPIKGGTRLFDITAESSFMPSS